MKLAIIQDWLTSLGGAEKCIEALCELWPDADIYTLIYRPDRFRDSLISHHRITTSFAQRLPWSTTKFRHYFALYPYAIEQFDLRDYGIVVSFSAAFAHGVLTDPDQAHICYKHTPMRYAWSGYQEYLADPQLRRLSKRLVAKLILHRMRRWDYAAAQRPDIMLANSEEVRRRIWKYYRRESQVVHPPVDVPGDGTHVDQTRHDYFVNIGRLVPYKRVDLIVQAFAQVPERHLVVAGSGPELNRLKEMAKGLSNVDILGFVDESQKIELLARARAFVFAAHEDFGIAPVEAQAYGTPIIAYGRGGALETVVEGQTGVFFEKQTVESLLQGIRVFEQMEHAFDPNAIRSHARTFGKEIFQRRFKTVVEECANRQECGVRPPVSHGRL